MKKILYIGGFEFPNRNAAAQRVLAVGKTMRDLGYDVEFIGVTKNRLEVDVENKFENFKYVCRSYPDCLLSWLNYLTSFISFDKISLRNPDFVVLYNFPAVAQMRVIKYCHRNNIKVIADLTEWYEVEGNTIHDIIKKWDINQRMKKINYLCDGIIVISKFLFNYYHKSMNTVYIPATVDLNDPKWERNRTLVIHEPIKLIYAGSPGGKHKDRIDELVNAIRYNKKFHLNIFGISEEQFIEKYDKNFIATFNIAFHGRISHNEVLKMLCNSDFQVIIREDNLVTRAGFPTKFSESLSCGTPVIATPSSNICDYLKDGVNGFVVDDKQTLDKCLERIINMRVEELLKMKFNAMQIMDFDYRNYISSVKHLLK